MASIPHFAYPFRLAGNGSFATVEQDTPDELAQCVAIALMTPIGSRIEDLDYGTPRMDFDIPDAGDIIAAIESCEPRVDLDIEVVRAAGGIESVTDLIVAVRPHVSDGALA
jgi:phage baseplate assembly protein W